MAQSIKIAPDYIQQELSKTFPDLTITVRRHDATPFYDEAIEVRIRNDEKDKGITIAGHSKPSEYIERLSVLIKKEFEG